MINNIIFYNHWHNGDVHVSRSFIRYIMNTFPNYNYFYQHGNSSKLLSDISNLKFNELLVSRDQMFDGYYFDNNDLYINTWYMSFERSHFKGCTLLTLYSIFTQTLKEVFNIDIPNEKIEFLPQIDFSKFNVSSIDKFIQENTDIKKILVCNNDVLSFQSKNFDFNPIIDEISTLYPNFLFIITNYDKNRVNKSNVVYFVDIFNDNDSDLNEIAYISTFCDCIIGRSSGPHSFAFIKENILDTNKLFIVLSGNNFGLYDILPKDKMCNLISFVDYDNILNFLKDIFNETWK